MIVFLGLFAIIFVILEVKTTLITFMQMETVTLGNVTRYYVMAVTPTRLYSFSGLGSLDVSWVATSLFVTHELVSFFCLITAFEGLNSFYLYVVPRFSLYWLHIFQLIIIGMFSAFICVKLAFTPSSSHFKAYKSTVTALTLSAIFFCNFFLLCEAC